MVPEPSASNELKSPDDASPRPKILYLGGAHDAQIDLPGRLGGDVDLVELSSSLKALALMGRDEFAGVYVDADRFSEASDVGRLLQNDRILQGMPDGVVLLAWATGTGWNTIPRR